MWKIRAWFKNRKEGKSKAKFEEDIFKEEPVDYMVQHERSQAEFEIVHAPNKPKGLIKKLKAWWQKRRENNFMQQIVKSVNPADGPRYFNPNNHVTGPVPTTPFSTDRFSKNFSYEELGKTTIKFAQTHNDDLLKYDDKAITTESIEKITNRQNRRPLEGKIQKTATRFNNERLNHYKYINPDKVDN